MLDDEQFESILKNASSIQLCYIRARIAGATDSAKAAKKLGVHRTTPHKWDNLEDLEQAIKTIQVKQIMMLYKSPTAFTEENEETSWLQSAQQVLTEAFVRGGKKREDQDRSGFVYVIEDTGSGYFKIGMSRDPVKRFEQIQPVLPFETLITCTFEVEDRYAAESFLHRRFSGKRAKGEWFDLSEEDLEWINVWGQEQSEWVESDRFCQLELV